MSRSTIDYDKLREESGLDAKEKRAIEREKNEELSRKARMKEAARRLHADYPNDEPY